MGEAAVIESGQIQLVACSYPALTPDPAFYECVGLQPDAALAVMAKNMTGWMAAFDAPWERGLLFDGPGVCTLDFASIPFTGSGRGLWPVDPEPGESGSDLGTGCLRLSRVPKFQPLSTRRSCS